MDLDIAQRPRIYSICEGGYRFRKYTDKLAMEVKKVKVSNVSEYMGGVGNIGYLWEFIGYFEKRLEGEIDPCKDWNFSAYRHCPNFAAWIRFYAELICNKALVELNRAERLEHKINSYRYRPVIEKVIKIAKEEKEKKGVNSIILEGRVKAIKLTVELRHSLQHGGIPNILRTMEFEEVSEDEVKKMIVPQNYLETKKIFQDANLLIEMLPRPTITVFANGRVEFKEPKERFKK